MGAARSSKITVPMVAAADIGREAAELLQEAWKGRSVVELLQKHSFKLNCMTMRLPDESLL